MEQHYPWWRTIMVKHNRNIKQQVLFKYEIISTFHLAEQNVKVLRKHFQRWERDNREFSCSHGELLLTEREKEKFAITFELCKLQIIFLQDIIFDCLKPIYNFLRALGVFPLSRSDSGEFQFKLQSPAMAYSILVFVAFTVNRYALWLLILAFQHPRTLDLLQLYSDGSDKQCQ